MNVRVPSKAAQIGDLAICSRGRIGVILDWKTLPWGESFVGIGLDDGSLWSSRKPTRIRKAERVEMFHALTKAMELQVEQLPK